MPLRDSTKLLQMAMAEYCRTGNEANIAFCTDKRIQQYRSLMLNNFHEVLSGAFPLVHNLLSAKAWDYIVTRFLHEHACEHFQIWKVADSFRRFICEEQTALIKKYPVLPDLLLFEWMEMELFNARDSNPIPVAGYSLLCKSAINLNTELRLFTLQFPVHLQPAQTIKQQQQGSYHILAYRHPETKFVHFVTVSELILTFINNLLTQHTVKQSVQKLAARYQIAEGIVIEGLAQFIDQNMSGIFIRRTSHD